MGRDVGLVISFEGESAGLFSEEYAKVAMEAFYSWAKVIRGVLGCEECVSEVVIADDLSSSISARGFRDVAVTDSGNIKAYGKTIPDGSKNGHVVFLSRILVEGALASAVDSNNADERPMQLMKNAIAHEFTHARNDRLIASYENPGTAVILFDEYCEYRKAYELFPTDSFRSSELSALEIERKCNESRYGKGGVAIYEAHTCLIQYLLCEISNPPYESLLECATSIVAEHCQKMKICFERAYCDIERGVVPDIHDAKDSYDCLTLSLLGVRE